MPISKTAMIAIYAAIGLYVLYKLLLRKDKFEEDYEKLYNDILTSDKYKVKGQYDDRS